MKRVIPLPLFTTSICLLSNIYEVLVAQCSACGTSLWPMPLIVEWFYKFPRKMNSQFVFMNFPPCRFNVNAMKALKYKKNGRIVCCCRSNTELLLTKSQRNIIKSFKEYYIINQSLTSQRSYNLGVALQLFGKIKLKINQPKIQMANRISLSLSQNPYWKPKIQKHV